MVNHMTNPAGRLFTFFERLGKMNPNETAVSGVSKALDLTWDDDWPHVLELGGLMQRTYADMMARLKASGDGTAAVTIPKLGQVEASLNKWPLLASHNLGGFLNGVGPVERLALEAASTVLERLHRDPALTTPQVKDLLESVRNLKTQVGESDIDPALRSWLLDRLLDLERALLHYEITGSDGVGRVLNEMSGALARNPEVLVAPKNRSVLRAVANVIVAIDLCLNLGANAIAVEAAAHPSTPSPVVYEIAQYVGGNLAQITVAGETYTIAPPTRPALPAAPSDDRAIESSPTQPGGDDLGEGPAAAVPGTPERAVVSSRPVAGQPEGD